MGTVIQGWTAPGEKYFRAFWTEPNSPPVDEWEVQATPFDGASGPSTQMRYSRGNREYPEFIGSAQFATGSGEGSYINFAVRGRYGEHLGRLGTHISPSLQQYPIITRHVVPN